MSDTLTHTDSQPCNPRLPIELKRSVSTCCPRQRFHMIFLGRHQEEACRALLEHPRSAAVEAHDYTGKSAKEGRVISSRADAALAISGTALQQSPKNGGPQDAKKFLSISSNNIPHPGWGGPKDFCCVCFVVCVICLCVCCASLNNIQLCVKLNVLTIQLSVEHSTV